VLANGVDVNRFADFPPPFAWPGVVGTLRVPPHACRPGATPGPHEPSPQDGTRSVPTTLKAPARVGCVANLRPVKNVDGLMRAARVVCDRFPQVVFEVAGDGEQRAELGRLRAALGLGDRFVLRGSVADVPGFLRTVDVAVLPSHSEGMSNALLEYLAAGRAVVATAVGANPTLVQEDGLIVPPGDDGALAEAIGRLVAKPDLARRLGAAARRRVEAEYSRDAMRRRFEDFYCSLTHPEVLL
jgi:L-malate glycosyltransferase